MNPPIDVALERAPSATVATQEAAQLEVVNCLSSHHRLPLHFLPSPVVFANPQYHQTGRQFSLYSYYNPLTTHFSLLRFQVQTTAHLIILLNLLTSLVKDIKVTVKTVVLLDKMQRKPTLNVKLYLAEDRDPVTRIIGHWFSIGLQ